MRSSSSTAARATTRRAGRAGRRSGRLAARDPIRHQDDVGGKGAALQQGVAATTGDLVAFVDADVHDPDPWLAIGTLAPLLMDRRRPTREVGRAALMAG
jgi:glucosyl-3-phosphoglycerate synthase